MEIGNTINIKDLLKHISENKIKLLLIITISILVFFVVGVTRDTTATIDLKDNIDSREITTIDQIIELRLYRDSLVLDTKDNMDLYNGTTSVIKSKEDELSENGTIYYKAIINGEETRFEQNNKRNLIKWVLGGFAIGVLISILMVIIPFCFSNKVKNITELQNELGWNIIKDVKELRQLLEKKKYSKAIILGEDYSLEDKILFTDSFYDADCAIIVIKVLKTNYNMVIDYYHECVKWGIPVLGVLSI